MGKIFEDIKDTDPSIVGELITRSIVEALEQDFTKEQAASIMSVITLVLSFHDELTAFSREKFEMFMLKGGFNDDDKGELGKDWTI